jgi:hypothetical protein
MPDEIIREEMALIPEKSPVAIAPKRRRAASKMAHKSAPVKRGKR